MQARRFNSTIRRNASRLLGGALLLLSIGGCSLLSFKSPERSLSTRDLNARILTREYSAHFIDTVQACADETAVKELDPTIRTNALRWKIGAATESQRAATRMSPMMGLLDTWALAAQMKVFLSQDNSGGGLFGLHQQNAVRVATTLDEEAEAMARRLIAPHEFPRYQQFVDSYTRAHPLQDLDFMRASVVELWSKNSPADVKLVDSLGTIPEAMADVSDRLQMYSNTLFSLNVWRTQLALQNSGFSGSDLRSALKQLDARLARMTAVAETSPQLVHGAVADVRRSVIDVLNRLDASSAAMIVALRAERTALTADVRTEREAVVVAADDERKAIAQDVAKIADQVVASSGEQIRSLAREVLLLLIVLAVVVLGLPFAAGYLVGRSRKSREPI